MPGFDSSLGTLQLVRLSHNQVAYAGFRGECTGPGEFPWTMRQWFFQSYSTRYTLHGQVEPQHASYQSPWYELQAPDGVACGGVDWFRFMVPAGELGFSIRLMPEHPWFSDFIDNGDVELTEAPTMGSGISPGSKEIEYCAGTPTVQLTRKSRVTYIFER